MALLCLYFDYKRSVYHPSICVTRFPPITASNKHRIMKENKIIFLLFVLTILLLPKGHQAFFLPTEQKPESREKVEYSCFPWIFNPGL